MKIEDLEKTANILDALGIKYSVENGVLLVDRDSIVKVMTEAKNENEAYELLRFRLNRAIGTKVSKQNEPRYIYAAKSDEWLMLDKIP